MASNTEHSDKGVVTREAFRNFYDSHFATLCMYANRFVKNEDVCADIVQECFVKLWDTRGSHRSWDSVKRFMYVSIRNRALNEIRHEDVRRKVHSEHFSGQELELEIIENEVKGIVWREIASLPAHYADVLAMSLKGYALEEISAKTGRSVQTVKNNKTAAVKMLKERITARYACDAIYPFCIAFIMNIFNV